MIQHFEQEIPGGETTQLIVNKKGVRLFLNDLIEVASSNHDCREKMLNSLRTKGTLHRNKPDYMVQTWDELLCLLDN